ncbi:MAG: DUF924 domain-containing protein [Aliivibrio sp.]|uniref:DUF924 family protein n=1 Tax=Aliivibrio sp. TaxID=1872443 RepID=UPI001A60F793|nr:DUF924 domain-containing protein [Aliivibrio sp.]
MSMQYQPVLNFWFEEITPADWWKKSEPFDQLIEQRFADVHRSAIAGELSHWRVDALGRLAEIIVLDQFSRNIYRDTPKAFSADPLSLALAQEAIAQNYHLQLTGEQRSFLYMPFMHSESKLIHQTAIEIFADPDVGNLDFELKHKAIIDKFGRYPHRNKILGRETTAEELEFLNQPGSSF